MIKEIYRNVEDIYFQLTQPGVDGESMKFYAIIITKRIYKCRKILTGDVGERQVCVGPHYDISVANKIFNRIKE